MDFELAPPDSDDQAVRRIIPDGQEVIVEVLNVEPITKKDKFEPDGSPMVRVGFRLKVVEGEYEGQILREELFNEFTASSRCKFYHWAQELLGQDLGIGFKLNTEHLIGRRAVATIGVREWTRQDGTGGRANTVKWLDRIAGSTPQHSPAATPLPPSVFGEEAPF